MKKLTLLLALLSIVCIKSYSQIAFEDGYFINELNQRTECLIKNIDWRNNPTEFEYKLHQDETVHKVSIQTVKEFGLNGGSKYIRALVNIDRSSDKIDNLSSDRNPVFKEELLFLKVLIENKASLFLYMDGNVIRLFYSLDDSEISQLVYKRFIIDYNIGYNNYFRQQLFIDLNCGGNTLKDVENVQYNQKDLKRFFVKYNECVNPDYIYNEPTQKKDLFNLSFRFGLNSSSLTIQNSVTDFWDTDFDENKSFRFGIETEYILPFNKNKWSIFSEPTYQYYESEKITETNNVVGGVFISDVKYQSVDMAIGGRHYIFLNNSSKIFINISYKFNIVHDSSLEFRRSDGSILQSLDVAPKRKMTFGFGYKLMDRYSLEMRYQPNREILGDYVDWHSRYKTVSIIFGLSFF